MNACISVIIPSYDSRHSIFNVLTALEHQDFQGDCEIIVVDSTPGELHSAIQARFPQVRVVHLLGKTCPGVARNRGTDVAQGDLFVFLDSDIYVDSDFLTRVQAAFARGKHIFSCALGVHNKYNILGWSNYLIEFNEFMPEIPGGKRVSIQSGCFIIPRATFEQYGGFTEKFLFSEDFHFATKLSSHGETMYFEPDIRVYHQNRGTIISYFKKNYILGRYGAWVRRIYPIQGNTLLKKYPSLAICSGGYKFLSILMKLWKYNKFKLIGYLLLSPFVFGNLLGYSLGFKRGNIETMPDMRETTAIRNIKGTVQGSSAS